MPRKQGQNGGDSVESLENKGNLETGTGPFQAGTPLASAAKSPSANSLSFPQASGGGRIRDRVVEMVRVPASTLLRNPRNWRQHPKEQSRAMRGVLADIGIADAVIARRQADGQLLLLDGHLRVQTRCDSEVIGLMLKKFRGSPINRMTKACREAMGVFPFASLALWPDRLIATTANNQPLHIGESRHGYWLASLPDGLPGRVSRFPQGEVLEFA